MFSVEWLGHKVALKASNGKYICTKKNGQLLAVSDSSGNAAPSFPSGLFFFLRSLPSRTAGFFISSAVFLRPPGEDERLTLKLINRPMLILRGENGFICHHRKSNTLDASRSIYDIFTLQFSNGAYNIKGHVFYFILRFGQKLPTSKWPWHTLCLTLSIPPRRCQRPFLVREQRRAGVLWRRGARGLLPGAARARPARHPGPQRKVPAWRPGRHPEGGRTRAEQLSPLGVLNSSSVYLQEVWLHRHCESRLWHLESTASVLVLTRLGADGSSNTPKKADFNTKYGRETFKFCHVLLFFFFQQFETH